MQFALLKDMGWYLVIRADDYRLINGMHKSVTVTAASRYFGNTHVSDPVTGDPKNDIASFYHPVRLGSGWLCTVEKGLQKYGVVYMNKRHGLWFGKDVEVLQVYDSDELKFPDDKIQDLKITISRYPGGAHWYLTPSDGRVFQYHKFNHLCYALEEANKHALVCNITVDERTRQLNNGD